MDIREATSAHAAALGTTPGMWRATRPMSRRQVLPMRRPPAPIRIDQYALPPHPPFLHAGWCLPVALAGPRRGAVHAGQEPGVHEAFAFDVDHSSVGDLEVVAKKSSGRVVDLDKPG